MASKSEGNLKFTFFAAGYITEDSSGNGISDPLFKKVQGIGTKEATWYIMGCAARDRNIMQDALTCMFANPSDAERVLRALLSLKYLPYLQSDGIMFAPIESHPT